MNRRMLQKRVFSSGVIASIALAMFACSSSSNSGSSGSTTTNTSTVSGFINSYCSYVATCCGSQGMPSDGTQCRELLEFANITNYDATKGQACIAAVESASASDPNWCVDSTSASSACDQVTSSSSSGGTGGTGSAGPGAKCNTTSDCAAGPSGSTVVCEFPAISGGVSSNQECIVQVHGKAGDGPCLGTVSAGTNGSTSTLFNNEADGGANAAPEIYCFVADGVSCNQATSTCAALVAVGSSCAGNLQCVSGAHCDFNTENCAADGGTGSACVLDSDCISGDYCATTCTAQGAEGAACTSFEQCVSGVCQYSKCASGSGSALGLIFLCGGTGDGG